MQPYDDVLKCNESKVLDAATSIVRQIGRSTILSWRYFKKLNPTQRGVGDVFQKCEILSFIFNSLKLEDG